jgi:chaperonin GroES
MKIKPLHDRILIRRDEPEARSTGGIIIPDTAKDRATLIGTVEAAGPGVTDQTGRFHEVTVKPGQRVLIGKYAGSSVPDFGDKIERTMVRDDDILGVVEDETGHAHTMKG